MILNLHPPFRFRGLRRKAYADTVMTRAVNLSTLLHPVQDLQSCLHQSISLLIIAILLHDFGAVARETALNAVVLALLSIVQQAGGIVLPREAPRAVPLLYMAEIVRHVLDTSPALTLLRMPRVYMGPVTIPSRTSPAAGFRPGERTIRVPASGTQA